LNALAERCFTCGQPQPVKPKCRMCGRPMEDWPDDPEKFLIDHGWEQAEYTGNWLEPMEDCTFEVSDEMVAEARKRVEQAKTYSEFKYVSESKDRTKLALENVAVAQANLDRLEEMRAGGERTDLQSLTDSRFLGTGQHGLAIHERHTTLSKRERCQHRLEQAVRMELNRGVPAERPRKVRTPRFGAKEMEAMERSYLMKDKGVLKPDSRQKLANRAAEVSEVYAEQCVFCRRWPDALSK
jgi:hypothetical protein